MALHGRGRPRYNPFTDPGLSSDEIRRLLTKVLGAKLIPDTDNTKPQRWSPTLEEIRERQEAMGLFSKLEGKIDLDAIPVNPFQYPDGTYSVRFDGATLRPITGQKEAEESLDFKYIILDDDTENGKKYDGKPITEGKWIPSEWLADENPAKAEEMLGFAIQRIAQLGFGEDARTVEVEDINALCMNRNYTLKLKKGKNEDSGSFVQWVKVIKNEDEEDIDLD